MNMQANSLQAMYGLYIVTLKMLQYGQNPIIEAKEFKLLHKQHISFVLH